MKRWAVTLTLLCGLLLYPPWHIQVWGEARKACLSLSGGLCSGGAYAGAVITLPFGGTGADLSGTGGAGQVLKQDSLGAVITVGTIASTALSDTTNMARLDAANVFSSATGQSMKKLLLPGSTSGTITVVAAAAAGTNTVTLPANAMDMQTMSFGGTDATNSANMILKGSTDWRFGVGVASNFEGYLKIGRGAFGNGFDFAFTSGGDLNIAATKKIISLGDSFWEGANANTNIRTESTGSILRISSHGGTSMQIDGADKVIFSADGSVTLTTLATTGAATGKTIVCADTDGKIYRSSSGVACAN